MAHLGIWRGENLATKHTKAKDKGVRSSKTLESSRRRNGGIWQASISGGGQSAYLGEISRENLASKLNGDSISKA